MSHVSGIGLQWGLCINEKDIHQAINGLPDMKEGEVEDYELGWDHITTLQ